MSHNELRDLIEHFRAHDQAQLFELRQFFTKNSQPVRGALALPVGTTDKAKTVLANSAGRLVGWSLKEATGNAAAEIDLLDGTSTDGDLLAPITLSAGESTRDWFGPAGISYGAGLFAQAVTGSVVGTVWIGRVDI